MNDDGVSGRTGQNRDDMVSTRTVVADTFRARARGLIATSADEWEGRQLILTPCKSVHTFGMRYALDIAFLDSRSDVIAYYRRVAPNRVRIGPRSSCFVAERPSRAHPCYEMGQHIDWRER